MNKICIVGGGYVGLPLAVLVAKKNINVTVYDNDVAHINKLTKYKTDIKDIQNTDLKNKYLSFSDNINILAQSKVIIVCLPTPLKNNLPDLSIITKFLNKALSFLKKNQTLILESTVYPGFTRNVIAQKLNKKFKVGKNFFLCFSPERIDPGNRHHKLIQIPKILSGYSNNCLIKGYQLYKRIFHKVIKAQNLESAEMTKIIENTYRHTNIALVNELKLFAHKINIDLNHCIKLASSKPFGYQVFYPGPGVGGHCIPIDPIYLNWISNKKYKLNINLISLSQKINNWMPNYAFQRMIDIINKNTTGKQNFLIFGMSYKKNITDLRESPAIQFIKLMIKNKKNFVIAEPYHQKINLNNKIYNMVNYKQHYKKYNIAIILTDHDRFDYNFIRKNFKYIFDSRQNFVPNNINIFNL